VKLETEEKRKSMLILISKQKTRVVYDAKLASFSVYSATGRFKKKIINYSFFN